MFNKLEHKLAMYATYCHYNWLADIILTILRKYFDKSYHFCEEWDGLVLSNEDQEADKCFCSCNK